MNLDQIEALTAVMDRVPRLSEVEVRTEDGLLLLRRAPLAPPPQPAPGPALQTPDAVPPAPQAVADGPQTQVAAAHVVGVFHERRGGAVSVGETVAVGDLLGHIDTMRIPNDCVASIAGRVSAVLVHDGDAVEYGQPLFEIVAEDPQR